MNAFSPPKTQWPLRGMNPLYPWSDGKPMAENSIQYQWIVTFHGNIDWLYRADPHVFVAADNLIYPEEGRPEICQAPDVYAVFGRPKEHRGSYNVFEEAGIFPQIIVEVRSPSNRTKEMTRKLNFYDRYGAEEYYDFDPNRNRLRVYTRTAGGRLGEVSKVNGFISPRMGIRFDTSGKELVVYHPDGERFLTYLEVSAARAAASEQAEQQRQRAEAEAQRAEAEAQRAEAEAQRAERVRQENDRLRELLRQAGINPDTLPPT